jgi:hypothetical protein
MKRLLPLAFALLLIGAGCSTQPAAEPKPATQVQTDGTLSLKSFTIAVPKDATVKDGTVTTATYAVAFKEDPDLDGALKAFSEAFKTRKGTKLDGQVVAYGSEPMAVGASTFTEQYLAIYNGDTAIIITMTANTEEGMTAARAFVQTIHWTTK